MIRDITRVVNEHYGYDLFSDSVGEAVAQVLAEEIKALPELAATSGRDFGRGYALAIKDVLALLGAT